MPTEPFPKPSFVTGGCLCGSVRYRVDFPSTHDFVTACQTCQCTQCRRTTGALFFPIHSVAKSALTFTPDPAAAADESSSATRATPTTAAPAKLKSYRATPGAERCFCADCGSFLFWRCEGDDTLDLAVGCIDPEFVFGEERVPGGEGAGRKRYEGFGRALAGATTHLWCANEIAGVTDRMLRGKKMERTSTHGVVLDED
ncbi:hypothetical protein EsH8_III_001200 [Colletotrichum jinshuiense]